jgi:hypothetical protein
MSNPKKPFRINVGFISRKSDGTMISRLDLQIILGDVLNCVTWTALSTLTPQGWLSGGFFG